ncbi:VaFE repeat-containing surface-anchored protein, partial [Lactococcus garvieae]|uniref:VaFE repeat-containing surface-anchored protein n=1 Tax=Lactococcus garvieae TaxID=1363 RepID=UPI003D784B6C
PIKAVSGPVTDSHGYTVNGITLFDGNANKAAGNPSSEGIAVGDYLLSETKTPQGLEPIDDVAVSFQVKTDKKGAPQTYTATFTDPVTHQEIYKSEVDASKLVDNHVMFKVNLGTFTDKKPAQPAIATTATDKADGDKTLGVGHVQVTDLVKVTGLLPEKTYTLTGKVVDKETGVFILDKEGKETTVSQSFTTNKAGAAELQLDFPLIDDSQDQGKDYRVAETVTDDQGYVVVEENDKDNLSQCVKVDRAEG